MLLLTLICAVYCIASQAATIPLSWGRSVGNQGTTTVNAGDTVTWTWIESIGHTVDSTTGVFSSGVRSSGSYSYTFTTAGTFPYHCSIHNFMQGTIKVVAADLTAAPTSGPTTSPTIGPPIAVSTAPSGAVSLSRPPTNVPSMSPSTISTYTPSNTPTTQPSPSALSTEDFPTLAKLNTISSGSHLPSSWNATLFVKSHRVETDELAFNTRSYCYEVNGEEVCSYPGPTVMLTPGDNFTLLLINELGPNKPGEGIEAAVSAWRFPRNCCRLL
jgi:FtsP/CotA-like multicopper oxidase with cupredoxin domain